MIDFDTTYPDETTGEPRYEWMDAFIENVAFAIHLEARYTRQHPFYGRRMWYKKFGETVHDLYFAPAGKVTP